MPAVVAGVLAAENAPSTAAPAVVAGAGDAFSKAGNTEAEHTELDAEAGGGPDASAQMIVGAEAGEVPAASTTAGTVGFSTRGVSTRENVGKPRGRHAERRNCAWGRIHQRHNAG